MRGVGGNSQSSLILVNLEEKPFTTSTSITHTAGSDNIFVQIYMDALPGVPGASKPIFLVIGCPKGPFLAEIGIQ